MDEVESAVQCSAVQAAVGVPAHMRQDCGMCGGSAQMESADPGFGEPHVESRVDWSHSKAYFQCIYGPND